MPYRTKDLANFSLLAVGAAIVAGIFCGPWALVGVFIALAILWGQGAQQGHQRHKPRCRGKRSPRGRRR